MNIDALDVYGSGATGAGARDLRSTDFMRLLTEQLKNQNPLKPASDAEFLGQLAQFSALEQSQSQSASLERLALALEANTSLQGLAQAATLIGKQVTFIDSSLGTERLGAVQGVRFLDGTIQLDIGGELVPLGNVISIDGDAALVDPPDDGVSDDDSGDDGSSSPPPASGGGDPADPPASPVTSPTKNPVHTFEAA